MKFIKENPVLSMGIFLPILLMGVFFASVQIPRAIEAPPSYDFFFTHKKYDYDKTRDYVVTYRVINGRISPALEVYGDDDKKSRSNYVYTLYRYNAETQTVESITPDVKRPQNGVYSITLPMDVQNALIDTSKTAPDGYKFHTYYNRYRGLFVSLFGYRSRDRGYVLSKGRSHHKVTPLDRTAYRAHEDDFLGWVIKDTNNVR